MTRMFIEGDRCLMGILRRIFITMVLANNWWHLTESQYPKKSQNNTPDME